jgi:hypothetical protein
MVEYDGPDKAPEEQKAPPYGYVGYQRPSRHERILRDIERSRNSRIPTWVLALTLSAIIVSWIVFVALA